MSEQPIINCHVHVFTTKHTPHHFPYKIMGLIRKAPWLITVVRKVLGLLGHEKLYETVTRLEDFHKTGQRTSQKEVLRELRHYYPKDTRFVALPLDLELIGYGPVDENIVSQHNELAELTRAYPDTVIPFANIYPDRPDGVKEFRRAIEELGFQGLKIYTKTGFAPDHPVLMNEVYPYCEERGLPVMSHCSRGGVHSKAWAKDKAAQDRVTEPYAYRELLTKFPKLQVCLAHYGGVDDWKAYLEQGFDPERAEAKDANWVYQINKMITSGAYPNLWTDISYTMFKFEQFSPLLKLFLADPAIKDRVLFGSDFYMTRQEALSEKSVSIRLRNALGEEVFTQIAKDNPRKWLGET